MNGIDVDNPGEDPNLTIIHLLRRLTVALDLLGTAFAREHDLHPTDLRALIELLDDEGAGETTTPGRLGSRLGLNSASTTALVDRLERHGHLRRRRDTRDRRRVILEVDRQARELGWGFFGPVIGDMLAAMETFTEAELATVRRFLVAISDVATSAQTPPRRPTA